MELLFEQFQRLLQKTDLSIKRYLYHTIDWKNRLIAITGARGSGKTTLMLQYIKTKLAKSSQTMYVSLDNIYFNENKLLIFIDTFVKNDGKYLFLDEVHKYPNWAIEIKNAYDIYKNLKIVFTGSSALEIHKSKADLSRRAVVYELAGLSFREFLLFTHGKKISTYSLKEILQHHIKIAKEISNTIKPIPAFNNYLKYGYYPFFLENKQAYTSQLQQAISLTIETDLPSIHSVDFSSIQKLKKLLYVLSQSVPSTPNISKLANRIETTRTSLLLYLHYLEKASLIKQLRSNSKGLSMLSKAEKIYPGNPNIMFALAEEKPDKGTLREVFLLNQLEIAHTLYSSDTADFLINNIYTVEVGGKGKDYTQIKQTKNAYLAVDDIEIGYHHKIPLWLFGFLY